MKENNYFIFIILSLLFIVFSYFFSFTPGIVAYSSNNQNTIYCSDLLSSGSNDNLLIQVAIPLYSIVLIAIFTNYLFKKFYSIEFNYNIYIFIIISFVQLILTILISLDCSIILTIIDGNIWFSLFILNLVVSQIVSLYYLDRFIRNK